MIYKYLETNEFGTKIYAKIDDDGLCRVTCTEDNQAFKTDLANGATLQDATGTAMTASDITTFLQGLK